MKLQIQIPDLLASLTVNPEPESNFTAHLPPDWREASDLIDARLNRQDPEIENARRRLNLLSEFAVYLPPVDTTEKLISAVLANDPTTLARLETTSVATRMIEWQATISVLSSQNSDPEHIPLNERPIEANFFAPGAPHFFLRSIVTSQLLEDLVLKESDDRWRYNNCPDLYTINPTWFQYFGQPQRTQVFDTAMRYLERLPDSVEPIGLNVIGRAIYAAIDDVRFSEFSRDSRNAKMIADFLRFSANLQAASDLHEQPTESPAPKRHDIIQLAQSDEIDMAIHCLIAERIASDSIRHLVIPELVQKELDCRDSYWAIHRARFSDAPASVQNFGESPFTLHNYTISAARGEFYSRNIGKLREVNVVCEGSFEHLPARHLATLSERFFSALETGLENPPESRENLLERLCLAQAFLTLSHLPFDGAGRTNEDFIVLYAKRMGVDFSLSNSGYRHHLSPLAEQFQKIETQFKYEFDRNTLLTLGIVPGKFDEDDWIQKVNNLLETVHLSGNDGFNVEKSLRSTDFIAALEGDEKARERVFNSFPSIVEMYELFSRALDEKYTVTAPEIAAHLDRGIARSLVTAPWEFRRELHGERERYQGDVLGEAFLKEHMHTRSSRFVSEKLRTHFSDLRELLYKMD